VCPGPTATNFFKAAGLRQSLLPADSRETCEQVVMNALRALAAGKSQVVSGWRNKILATIGARVPKPLATRVAAKVIAHYRPQADSTHSAGSTSSPQAGSGQASSGRADSTNSPQAEKP
jgi:hypothetical protein